jgi:hypothetical protein
VDPGGKCFDHALKAIQLLIVQAFGSAPFVLVSFTQALANARFDPNASLACFSHNVEALSVAKYIVRDFDFE